MTDRFTIPGDAVFAAEPKSYTIGDGKTVVMAAVLHGNPAVMIASDTSLNDAVVVSFAGPEAAELFTGEMAAAVAGMLASKGYDVAAMLGRGAH